jgi:branched-chain amino acid transport system substrate-binding protein
MQQDRGPLSRLGTQVVVRGIDDGVHGVYSPARDAQNARILAADPSVFAEDGPYNSGAAAASMPVYNRADLVQISPGNTFPGLTYARNLAQYQPVTAAGGHGRTYFRVCATDALQGPAGARFAKTRFGLTTGYIVNDQGLPGIGLADEYAAALPGLGIRVLGRAGLNPSAPAYGSAAIVAEIKRLNPGAIFFGGDPETGGHVFADALRNAGVQVPLISNDALLTGTWVVGANGVYHPGSQNSWFTAIGPNPTKDPRARAFTAAYRAAFHATPNSFAVLSYDAANIEINALVRAIEGGAAGRGTAALREAVRANVASAHYSGVGGAGHFHASGDTTNHVISMWRVTGRTPTSFQWLGYVPGFAPHSG